MNSKNILIIDHNIKNLDTLRSLLEMEGYGVISVTSESELHKLRESGDISLFLVATHVNFISLEDIFGMVEYSYSAIHPIVFIDSSKIHDKDKLDECFRLGGVDYIKKPFDSKEIISRVNFHVTQFMKLSEYRLRLDKLIGLATTDQLSKFSSKMHMQAILKHTIELNDKHPSPTSVIHIRFLDVERVSSSFGFDQGERLISQFSKILKKHIRDSDAVGRWSGANFIVMLPHTEVHTAEEIAKKLYMNLTKTEIVKNIKPTLAMGITDISVGDSVEAVLDKAKYAMEHASGDGYDRVSIFGEMN